MSRSRKPKCGTGRGCGVCGDCGEVKRKREDEIAQLYFDEIALEPAEVAVYEVDDEDEGGPPTLPGMVADEDEPDQVFSEEIIFTKDSDFDDLDDAIELVYDLFKEAKGL